MVTGTERPAVNIIAPSTTGTVLLSWRGSRKSVALGETTSGQRSKFAPARLFAERFSPAD